MTTKPTLFLTQEEADRVRDTIKDRTKQCKEQAGQTRALDDASALTQEAISSALMQDFASAAFGFGASQTSDKISAYATGSLYLPSQAELSELKPIQLSELQFETHHRGRVLRVRRASPVVQMKVASWAAVQGESSEDAARLEVFLHKSRHGKDLLDLGLEFLVKEPYYTLNNQSQPAIRVDHPSDIIISQYSDGPESWRNKESASSLLETTAAKCKDAGNKALGKSDFTKAYLQYTEGLKLIDSADESSKTLLRDLHRNRSHVNLILQQFDEAKADAMKSLVHGESPEDKALDAKAFYRAGSAAYRLGEFQDAKELFEQQEKLEPNNQNANISVRRTKLRLKEQTTGKYDLNKVVASLAKTKGKTDLASYEGHTEVKESAKAGRGLFATQDIGPGEIVMCEKPFCLVWSHEPEALSALTCDLRDNFELRVFPSGLHMAVVQKMMNNPSQAQKVLELYSDHKGLGSTVQYRDGMPLIDSFQVHDIVQRNAFGAGQQTEDEDIRNASTGLWVRAAYINHSCVPNVKKNCIGDLMIVRANRAIKAGEELTQSYDETSDYDERTASLKRTWGFKCNCELCTAEEADGAELRGQRREIEKEVTALIQGQSGGGKALVSKVKRLHKRLGDTYDKNRYKGLPRRAMEPIEQWLSVSSGR